MRQSEKELLELLLGLVQSIEKMENTNMDDWLERIKKSYISIGETEQLWKILDDMCGDIPQTYMMLLDYLYTAVQTEAIIKKQYEILEKAVSSRQVNLFYAIFYKWQLISRNFLLFGSSSLFIERSRLQIALLDKMKEYLGFDLEPIPRQERNDNKILVTCTQLLGVKHGPTRNALDYCYTLQKKLGKEVFLFVAAETPTTEMAEYESCGIEYRYFNHCDDYEGYFTLDYLDEQIHGYQCKINDDKRDNIIDIIIKIYQWKPYLVYHIGTENLIVDLCGTFVDEVCVPTANEYPISEAKYHVVTRGIEERDEPVLKFLEERNQKVIESLFVYKLEEPIKKYSKNEFGISENAYVIVIVGARLDQEIKEPFISIMKTILKLDPRICFAFIGNFKKFEERQRCFEEKNRLIYLGFQDDLRGVLNIAELYLNPPRKGGGTSAAEALMEGVPVITLGKCDVAYTSGAEFLVESLEGMPELVRRYMEDEEFCRDKKEKAYQQAQRVVDTEAVLRAVLTQVENLESSSEIML
jgi:glycosyltransferase involved in cell wall biosynthesis